MATVRRFEDLEIWQLARQLSNKVLKLTQKEKFSKDFGFKGQIKDSSGSVMDNIAEGFGRGGNKEFSNFLSFSTGSCCEVQSQLYRALDWNYITKYEFDECNTLAKKIISKSGKFIAYLNQSQYKGEKFKNRK
jgi:four helix bundle protein